MLKMKNEDLLLAVRALVKEERRVTRAILEHINEVERRRLFAELGFSSIFDWLVKDLGYSESAAYRRMQAARVLRAVPEAAAKIESGALALTTLSKVQTLIRADEKRTGLKLSPEAKSEIVAKVEGCSSRETEKRLAEHFPEVVAQRTSESVRELGKDRVQVSITLTHEQFEKLKRVQQLLSHRSPGASTASVLEAAIDVFLERKDPLVRKVSARVPLGNTASGSGRGQAVKPSLRNAVFRKAQGQCEYRDVRTGRRCDSTRLLEVDHIWPRALGGGNERENLRVLCRTHNQLMAERYLGRFRRIDHC